MAAPQCWHQPNRPAASRNSAASISASARHSATAWCHIVLARRKAAWRASWPPVSAAARRASRQSRLSMATFSVCSCQRDPSSACQCGSAGGRRCGAWSAGLGRAVGCGSKKARSAGIAVPSVPMPHSGVAGAGHVAADRCCRAGQHKLTLADSCEYGCDHRPPPLPPIPPRPLEALGRPRSACPCQRVTPLCDIVPPTVWWGLTRIARTVGVSRPTVIGWRDRCQQGGIAALEDEPRSGRPAEIDEISMVAGAKHFGCRTFGVLASCASCTPRQRGRCAEGGRADESHDHCAHALPRALTRSSRGGQGA